MKPSKRQMMLLKFYAKYENKPLTLFHIARTFLILWLLLLLPTLEIYEDFSLTWSSFAFTHSGPMAKPLTKSQIVASVAETVGLTKAQTVQTLEALVALAYKNAKNSFTLPGLGKLVLVNRKARMGRNPATGAAIKIPAKRVVKFRVAKAAKDAILGTK